MREPYTLIRAVRRTVSLQVKASGEIVVRAPRFYPKYLLDRFVQSKSAWIAKRQKDQSQATTPRHRFCSDEDLKILLQNFVTHYSKQLGLLPRSLRFTTVSSYWGSCSPTGVLSFNLKLAYTQPDAVEYVVVHELAHLRYRGHGLRFWELVKKHYPKTNEVRAYLRQFPRE